MTYKPTRKKLKGHIFLWHIEMPSYVFATSKSQKHFECYQWIHKLNKLMHLQGPFISVVGSELLAMMISST